LHKQFDQLKPLIRLLDDPDQETFDQIGNEILSLGLAAVEPLEEAWFKTSDQLSRRRIEELIHHIQYNNLHGEMTVWCAGGGDDLLKGFVIANKFRYPNLDEEKIVAEINKLTRSVWIELNDNLTSLEKIKVLNQMFFNIHNFGGEVTNIHIPEHFFLNNLMQTHHGNAVSLGILYIIVAQKLMLPVKGVDLAGNFIACLTHTANEFTSDYKPMSEVKFYINPFAMGAVFTRKEISLYLEKAGIEPAPSCYMPAGNIAVIRRWCNDLMQAYYESGQKEKARDLRALSKVIS
jgi:regulator of sirC expression with transglutaminase-like and TPR domain